MPRKRHTSIRIILLLFFLFGPGTRGQGENEYVHELTHPSSLPCFIASINPDMPVIHTQYNIGSGGTLVIDASKIAATGLFDDQKTLPLSATWPPDAEPLENPCFELASSALGNFTNPGARYCDDRTTRYRIVDRFHTFSSTAFWRLNASAPGQAPTFGFFIRILSFDPVSGEQQVIDRSLPLQAPSPSFLPDAAALPVVDVLATASELVLVLCFYFASATERRKSCEFAVWSSALPYLNSTSSTRRVFTDLSYAEPRVIDGAAGLVMFQDRALPPGQMASFSARTLAFGVIDFKSALDQVYDSIELQSVFVMDNPRGAPANLTLLSTDFRNVNNINPANAQTQGSFVHPKVFYRYLMILWMSASEDPRASESEWH